MYRRPPPLPHSPQKESARETTSLFPIFFLRGVGGGGASVHRQKSNHYRIDQSASLASGSYSNTVLRKDLIPGPSLQKLLCCFCSYMDPLMQCGIGADEVVHKKWCLDLLKSAKLRWFKVQKFRKTKLAQRKNKINVLWKRHVIR